MTSCHSAHEINNKPMWAQFFRALWLNTGKGDIKVWGQDADKGKRSSVPSDRTSTLITMNPPQRNYKPYNYRCPCFCPVLIPEPKGREPRWHIAHGEVLTQWLVKKHEESQSLNHSQLPFWKEGITFWVELHCTELIIMYRNRTDPKQEQKSVRVWRDEEKNGKDKTIFLPRKIQWYISLCLKRLAQTKIAA